MRKFILILITSLACTSAFAVTQGDIAPAWTGIDLVDGAKVEFPAKLDEKPAVFIFWATWCSYCKAFMPYVKGIEADYAKQGVQIITFNAKERGRGDPKAYVDSLDFPLVAIADADEIAFTRNATEGNSTVASGLQLSSGDEVIFESHAHPGGAVPWMNRAKPILRILVPIAAAGMILHVKEFLAVRALGLLALMAAAPFLYAAYLEPQASRILVPIFAYGMIFCGLFWVGMPFTMRDAITWAVKTDGRYRALTLGGLGYGVVVLVCSVLWW